MVWLSFVVAARAGVPGSDVEGDAQPMGPPGPHTVETPAPVVGGALAPANAQEVVALGVFDADAGVLFVQCTGTVVQDDWILTAAHCIDEIDTVATEEGLDRVAVWGGNLVDEGATEVIGWSAAHRSPDYDPDSFTGDAGLVQLEAPHPSPVWVTLRDEPLDADVVGDMVEVYGFGATADFREDLGIKRVTELRVDSVDDHWLMTFSPEANLCSGDSGGPSYLAGVEQVGINAFVTPGCIGGRGGHTRVDAHIDWIVSLVPDVVLDPADLPSDRERPDLQPTDLEPLGLVESGACGGCQARGGGAAFWGLVALLALVRRRHASNPRAGNSQP